MDQRHLPGRGKAVGGGGSGLFVVPFYGEACLAVSGEDIGHSELMEAALALRLARHPTRTSGSQFETLVTFMERHGDLSKTQLSTKSRYEQLKAWQRLGDQLNADRGDGGSGVYTRSLDKWKKVWSDLKNNTKKKAHRLVSASRPAAGAPPPTPPRLSQLEFRVLKLMGMVKKTIPASIQRLPVPGGGNAPAPGLPAPGLHAPRLPVPSLPTPSLSSPGLPAPSLPGALLEAAPEPTQHDSEVFELTFDAWGRPMTHQDPLTELKSEQSPDHSAGADDSFCWPQAASPSPSPPPPPTPSPADLAVPADRAVSEAGTEPERPEDELSAPPRPDARGHTNTRGVQNSARRANRALQRAAAAFLEAAAQGRRDERARLRLRAAELSVQRQWQRIARRGLLLVERLLERGELAPVAAGVRAWHEAPPPGPPYRDN